MKQRNIEEMMVRLKNGESVILELLLLAYPLLLIGVNTMFSPSYLMIALAVGIGIAAFIFFEYVSYRIYYSVFIALIIGLPFYFVNLPLTVVLFIFIYAFWRYHSNFGMSRLYRWNFLTLNLFTFTGFYFIIRSYLPTAQAAVINKVSVQLFIVTTLLYIILRYVVIAILKRVNPNFKMSEMNQLFGLVLVAGIGTYLFVYFFVETIRTGVISVIAFLFGGLFMTISTMITPFIDYLIDYLDYLRQRAYEEMEPPEFGYVEHQMEEKRNLLTGNSVDLSLYVVIALVILALVIFVMISRKKKQGATGVEEKGFSIRSLGRKNNKNEEKTAKWLYSDLSTTENVRLAYQDFEREAKKSDFPRFVGETVKEWFIRTGWSADDQLFTIYEKVRYGNSLLTEEEQEIFITTLEKIKENNFIKEV